MPSSFPIYELDQISPEVKDRIMKRSKLDVTQIESQVRKIIEDVREKGDYAITEFLSSQLGKSVSPDQLVLKDSDVSEAYKKLESKVLSALKHLIRNVRAFHKMQLPRPYFKQIEPGVYAGQNVIPLDSAGLYVPSGKASYPSVSAMNTIAASVAGVPRIVISSPPSGNEMKMDAATIVAAHLSGAKEFYIMGGSHAIAALAYGTQHVKPVEVVAGPGSPWTYAAKKLVGDVVRTDLPAGPSEAMIFSDGSVSARQVALDVLNEAEHGPESAGVLVTISRKFADLVAVEIENILAKLEEPRLSFIKENASKYSAIIVCRNVDQAFDFLNEYSAEHLCIDSRRARQLYSKYKKILKNYGTLCLNSPISAGNFGVGPNSTLPTGGYARAFSGMSVDVFLKKPTVEELRGRSWKKAFGQDAVTLARYEGFPVHALALEEKIKEKG
jgi:histidinol dehydrogenase